MAHLNAASQVVGKRYQILEPIGAGGMGEVFRGLDARSEQPVAVKRLKSEALAEAPDLIERFRREGEALRQLNHPNIVKILDTVEENNQYYLIMEYVSGGSLADLLKRQPQLPIERTLQIALELADALTRTHHLKIIHRDLKPANVLLAEDGTPRLTDFGVARVHAALPVTEANILLGTPDYLSPEALNGGEVDARSDLWAFGVMLFEMLTGRRPFAGDSLLQVLTAITTQAVPDLEALRPDVPVALVDLIYRMLAKDRETRIPSARLVGAELDAIGQGASLSTPSRPEQQTILGTVRFITPTPSIDAAKNNLPAQGTPFVGRETELEEIARLLGTSDIRLVTVLGPGGMGKTRFALEAAQAQLEHFANGVFLVELAPLSAPENIVPAVAEALGYQFQQDGREPKQQIQDYLREKNMLLILDNFEHLLEGVGLVNDMLRAASAVKIVATSRERLNLGGEVIFALDGMDFPDWETPEDALNYSAVKLFMQSASRAQPGYELKTDDLQYIARICRLVQGMPLGILLAAAWLKMLSPQEIADEIRQSLDFLESSSRDLPERQRSIRAVFDYSWKLLTPPEQEAFMILSVFRGGCTRQAAQHVTGASLLTLAALVDKSLLRRNPNSGRYDIHELLRQYAEERLERSGAADVARDAHGRYFAEFMFQLEADLKGHRQLGALNDIESDIENVRAAWNRAVGQQNDQIIYQSLGSLCLFYETRSRFQEGKEMFGQALQHLSSQPTYVQHPTWNRILVRQVRLRALGILEQQEDATLQVTRSLAIAEKHNDRTELAFCYWTLGEIAIAERDYTSAVAYIAKSLAHYHELPDKFPIARLFQRLVLCYGNMGNMIEYMKFARQGLAVAREIGDQIATANYLYNLGSAAIFAGNFDEGDRYQNEALIIRRKIGDLANIALNTAALGLTAFEQGDVEKARELAEEALEIATEINHNDGRNMALCVFGALTILEEDYPGARQFFEECRSIAVNPSRSTLAEMGLSLAACGLGDYQSARQHNQAALQFAAMILLPYWEKLTFPCSVVILAHDGKFERAVELLALATSPPGSMEGWMEKWPLLNRLRVDLEAELGAEAFATAWERGKGLDPDTVVTELLESAEAG